MKKTKQKQQQQQQKSSSMLCGLNSMAWQEQRVQGKSNHDVTVSNLHSLFKDNLVNISAVAYKNQSKQVCQY